MLLWKPGRHQGGSSRLALLAYPARRSDVLLLHTPAMQIFDSVINIFSFTQHTKLRQMHRFIHQAGSAFLISVTQPHTPTTPFPLLTWSQRSLYSTTKCPPENVQFFVIIGNVKLFSDSCTSVDAMQRRGHGDSLLAHERWSSMGNARTGPVMPTRTRWKSRNRSSIACDGLAARSRGLFL